MIYLNFGVSDFDRHCLNPCLPEETYNDLFHSKENIIEIPEEGKLPVFGPIVKEVRSGQQFLECCFEKLFDEYNELSKIDPEQDILLDRPAVIIRRPRKTAWDDNDIDLILMWIKERSEWIVIWRRTWTEGSYCDDEFFSGPFALDEMCANKILQAYGLPKGIDVNRIDPETKMVVKFSF